MVNDVSVHLLLYLDGAAIADEVKGDAVTTNEANVDEDRMRLRRVDIARRVVALRLIDDIIISCYLFVCEIRDLIPKIFTPQSLKGAIIYV